MRIPDSDMISCLIRKGLYRLTFGDVYCHGELCHHEYFWQPSHRMWPGWRCGTNHGDDVGCMGTIGHNIGGCIGIMEKKIETTIQYIGVYIGIMEKKMETTT